MSQKQEVKTAGSKKLALNQTLQFAAELTHLHIRFRELSEAVRWMKTVLEREPVYENPGMAVFAFGQTSLIFDRGDEDTEMTIAFGSVDCDGDFSRLCARGAQVVEPPSDQPWGVRTAYLNGPGRLIFELETQLPRPSNESTGS